MTFHKITNQGTRDYNEDSAACIEADGDFCFVVADGLGGHGKGEVASGKTVEVFQNDLTNATKATKNFCKTLSIPRKTRFSTCKKHLAIKCP